MRVKELRQRDLTPTFDRSMTIEGGSGECPFFAECLVRASCPCDLASFGCLAERTMHERKLAAWICHVHIFKSKTCGMDVLFIWWHGVYFAGS